MVGAQAGVTKSVPPARSVSRLTRPSPHDAGRAQSRHHACSAQLRASCAAGARAAPARARAGDESTTSLASGDGTRPLTGTGRPSARWPRARAAVRRASGSTPAWAATVTVPAGRPSTGVVFVRTDLPGGAEVRVRPENAALRPRARAGARSSRERRRRSTPWSTCSPRSPGSASTTCVIETDRDGVPEPADGSAGADRDALLRRRASSSRTGRTPPHQGHASR